MPGLLRGLARTGAVAGTAAAVGGRVRRRQDAKFAKKNEEPSAGQGQAAPPAAPAADPLERLKTLGELKEQGVLTEAEFQAQKAKILAG